MSERDEKTKNGEDLALAAGRRLVVGGDDRLEIRSPDGQLELSITIGESGPIVSLKAARLEVESSDEIALRCRDFKLQTQRGIQFEAGGDVGLKTDREVWLRSGGQTHLDGDWVNINCQQREGTGYHDDPSLPENAALKEAADPPEALPSGEDDTPGCCDGS